MRIEEHGDQIIIEDSPASIIFGRLVGFGIGLTFLYHAVNEWRAFLAGAEPNLKPVLLASVGVIGSAVICAILLISRSIIVIDRHGRRLSVEQRRLQGNMVEDIDFDDIAEVTVKLASGGEHYEVDVIKRSGGSIRLSSTIQYLDKAQEIANTIREVRRK